MDYLLRLVSEVSGNRNKNQGQTTISGFP